MMMVRLHKNTLTTFPNEKGERIVEALLSLMPGQEDIQT